MNERYGTKVALDTSVLRFEKHPVCGTQKDFNRYRTWKTKWNLLRDWNDRAFKQVQNLLIDMTSRRDIEN